MTDPSPLPEPVSFSVQILFSEALTFDLDEIVQAVAEDFPECRVAVPSFCEEIGPVSTDQTVVCALCPVDTENGDLIAFSGMGFVDEDFRTADHTELAWRSGSSFAQKSLDAIKAHQSYLTLSISAKDTSLASRFRAARQLMAVSAVFAQLPITLGVLVQWSAHMVDPAVWAEGAHRAAKGEWPITSWISFRGAWEASNGPQTTYAVGYTTGLAHFLDFEFHLEPAPIMPTEAIKILYGACWLPLEGGSKYRDGDTMGVEDSGLKYTMRRKKLDDGALGPVMSLIHPESPLDMDAVFGPNPLAKPPPGYDNTNHANIGFLKRLLGTTRKVH